MDSFNTQDFENQGANLNRSVMDAWAQAKNKHDKAYQGLEGIGNINELASGLTLGATQILNKLGAGTSAKAFLNSSEIPTNIVGKVKNFISPEANAPTPSNTTPPAEEGAELNEVENPLDISEEQAGSLFGDAPTPTPALGDSAETSFGGESSDSVTTTSQGATQGAEQGAEEGAEEGADVAGEVGADVGVDAAAGTIEAIGAGFDATGIGSVVGLALGALGGIVTGINGLVDLIEGHHKQAQNTNVDLSQLPNASFTPGVS